MYLQAKEEPGYKKENDFKLYMEVKHGDNLRLQSNMLEAMADQAEGDAALKNVVVQWADYIRKLEPVLEMTGSSGEEVSADEAADALVQGVDQLPALLRQGAEYIRTEGLNGVQFRFKAAVSPEGVPKQLTAYAGNEEEAYEIGFEYLPEIGNRKG